MPPPAVPANLPSSWPGGQHYAGAHGVACHRTCTRIQQRCFSSCSVRSGMCHGRISGSSEGVHCNAHIFDAAVLICGTRVWQQSGLCGVIKHSTMGSKLLGVPSTKASHLDLVRLCWGGHQSQAATAVVSFDGQASSYREASRLQWQATSTAEQRLGEANGNVSVACALSCETPCVLNRVCSVERACGCAPSAVPVSGASCALSCC